ncbi:MAG: hypothetical protein KGN01_08175 [Patescibacteria group bacterium]|nr:hypothetical protein [Patescibacteria group bacterium]
MMTQRTTLPKFYSKLKEEIYKRKREVEAETQRCLPGLISLIEREILANCLTGRLEKTFNINTSEYHCVEGLALHFQANGLAVGYSYSEMDVSIVITWSVAQC